MANRFHDFQVIDFVILALSVAGSIGIGIYYALSGGRQKTTSEYLVGGRKLKFLPVAISLLVSFESSILMLGIPAEAYFYGIQWWISILGFVFAQITSLTLCIPLVYPLKLTSAYEYLELRYKSVGLRLFGTLLGFISTLWYMGIVVYGPAIALEAVTGLSQWVSMTSIAVAAVIYTSIGGIKAVVWTDVFQALIMFTGTMAILIQGTIYAGGPAAVWTKASEGGRFNFFNFDMNPYVRHTFWGLFFGAFIRGLSFTFNQPTIQRISSTKSLTNAFRVGFLVPPLFFITMSLAVYEGIIAYAYYQTVGCDPMASGQIDNPNQIIPLMVIDMFKKLPGMPGLFMVALFSASLSTVSTCLSSVSVAILHDFGQKLFKNKISDAQGTLLAKISVIFGGVLAYGSAIIISKIGGTLVQITSTLTAACSSPLSGLFMLSAFCPWANRKGAFVGTLVSVIFSFWMAMGSSFSTTIRKAPTLPPAASENCYSDFDNMTTLINVTLKHGFYSSTPDTNYTEPELEGFDKIYGLSYLYIGPLAIMFVLIVGSAVSLLTGAEEVDEKLIAPCYNSICGCFPPSIQKFLRFKMVSKIDGVAYAPIKTVHRVRPESNGKVSDIPHSEKSLMDSTREYVPMTMDDEVGPKPNKKISKLSQDEMLDSSRV